MAWGTSWDKIGCINPKTEIIIPNDKLFFMSEKGITEFPVLKLEGSNLIDDNKFLYFQCEGCQSIFDPETKSFKTLHDKTHAAGWKVRWNMNGLGYKVYCVECGKGVE